MIARSACTALVAVTLVAAPAAPAQAFFGHCCRKAAPTTTFYAPVAAAPVIAAPACPQQQVVNYMPQTAFRSVIVQRPVTTFVPQAACGPCGQPTTVMRPVTTFVSQQQLVPYTTFRPVVTTVASPCCGAAPTTVSFAPAPVIAPAPVAVAPAAPACCGSTPVPTLSSPAPMAAPAGTVTPVPSLAPQPGQPGSSLDSLQPTPDPSLNAPASSPSSANPTFAPSSTTSAAGSTPYGTAYGSTVSPSTTLPSTSLPATTEPAPQSRMLLPPLKGSSSSMAPQSPRGLDPEGGDRITAIPARSNYTVRQASLVVPIKAAPSQPAQTGGWEAAD